MNPCRILLITLIIGSISQGAENLIPNGDLDAPDGNVSTIARPSLLAMLGADRHVK